MKKLVLIAVVQIISSVAFGREIEIPCLGEATAALSDKLGVLLTEKELNADSLSYELSSYSVSEGIIDVVITYSFNDEGIKFSANSFVEVPKNTLQCNSDLAN